jgi:hydroxyethylthiazole kinase-like uncharacterized protein yjeF
MAYVQFPRLKTRKINGKKGDHGKLLIIAGSKSYPGAAYLAAMAAYRTGVDSVLVIAPSRVAWAINALSPDIMTKKVDGDFFHPSHLPIVKKHICNADAVLIGNGVTLDAKQFTQKIIRYCTLKRVKLIVDADALKVITLQMVDNAILTPNSKEYTILLKNSNYAMLSAAELQKKLNNIVVLCKGPTDKIMTKKKMIVINKKNTTLTVSGRGDVLAGICAGLVAQGNSLVDSAVYAAKLNTKIGEVLLHEKGHGFVASDYLEKIPKNT